MQEQIHLNNIQILLNIYLSLAENFLEPGFVLVSLRCGIKYVYSNNMIVKYFFFFFEIG